MTSRAWYQNSDDPGPAVARRTPRLSTLQRELDKLNKQYYRAASGRRRRLIEGKIQAITAAIAEHKDYRKGVA